MKGNQQPVPSLTPEWGLSDDSKWCQLRLSNHTQSESFQIRPHTCKRHKPLMPCLNFWPTDSVDKINGGFKPVSSSYEVTSYCSVTHQPRGSVSTDNPNNKQLCWTLQNSDFFLILLFCLPLLASIILWKTAFLQPLVLLDYTTMQLLQKGIVSASLFPFYTHFHSSSHLWAQ